MQNVGLVLDTHPDRHPPTLAKEEHKRFMLKIWRRGKTGTLTGSAEGEKTENSKAVWLMETMEEIMEKIANPYQCTALP